MVATRPTPSRPCPEAPQLLHSGWLLRVRVSETPSQAGYSARPADSAMIQVTVTAGPGPGPGDPGPSDRTERSVPHREGHVPWLVTDLDRASWQCSSGSAAHSLPPSGILTTWMKIVVLVCTGIYWYIPVYTSIYAKKQAFIPGMRKYERFYIQPCGS